jgi:hypothetical protein
MPITLSIKLPLIVVTLIDLLLFACGHTLYRVQIILIAVSFIFRLFRTV